MKNNMYAIVLFLVVITSTNSVCANDDEEIAMVVDDQKSNVRPTGIPKADKPIQIGRLKLEDGKKLLTLLNGRESSCTGYGGDCSTWTSWCCVGYICSGNICTDCTTQGHSCSSLHNTCCPEFFCRGGTCQPFG